MGMHDSFNLAWKLAAVIKENADPQLLDTYEEERRPIAQRLLDFDRQFYEYFDEPLSKMSVEDYRVKFTEATSKEHCDISGVSVCYADIHASHESRHVQSSLAPGIPMGKRFPGGTVIRQADGRALDLLEVLPSTGHWRVLVFPVDLRESALLSRYVELGQSLQAMKTRNARLCEILSIHGSARHDIDLMDLPEIFHPWHEEFGWDYGKVFADDTSYHDSTAGVLYRDLQVSSEGL
ncbi:hypothetical protein PRZ48_013448 [Zasmidium cellare]|uniref:FAD-binding domain-containing protein n=1 Tax=Zasmidium cellare TaxID=395010 RepID=A0ABR0E114_ZASCE|nr:hypothetical protein PRZ48_013448 [Zasmidium cellare]